jgi:hypothetical protein
VEGLLRTEREDREDRNKTEGRMVRPGLRGDLEEIDEVEYLLSINV